VGLFLESLDLAHNLPDHAIKVLIKRPVLKADHTIAARIEVMVAPRIAGHVMVAAIKFHNQFGPSASKINDPWSDADLPTEFMAAAVVSQFGPQHRFVPGAIAAKGTGPLQLVGWNAARCLPGHAGIMPTPNPSRKREGSR
jgi:hypothetical protein